MAEKLSSLVARLEKRGPHRVLVGDLDYAGMAGKVYVPAEGNGVPGVVFGHDWLTGVDCYHATFRHLASWGIAVAAPDTEKGVNPHTASFAEDLRTSLSILAGVRMGEGAVTIHPKKLALAGHGMGASAAVLAAADLGETSASYQKIDGIRSVAAIFPRESAPQASGAALKISVPGLILAPGENTLITGEEAMRIAARWKGDAIYREVEKANAEVFSEAIFRSMALGLGGMRFGKRAQIRSLLTAFLLATLDDKGDYKAALTDEKLKGMPYFSKEEVSSELPENVDLLKRFSEAF